MLSSPAPFEVLEFAKAIESWSEEDGKTEHFGEAKSGGVKLGSDTLIK